MIKNILAFLNKRQPRRMTLTYILIGVIIGTTAGLIIWPLVLK